MHDIKQALFQTSIPDHEQHENKVSTIDFVRPPNIQILMHDIKQALFQTSIPDHEQHENKVSTIDFVRLPINDIEEETMEEVLIDVINEDDYNSYSRKEIRSMRTQRMWRTLKLLWKKFLSLVIR